MAGSDRRGGGPTRVFFLHVPKTAGTTLTRHLDGRFDPADVFPPRTYPMLAAEPPDALPRYRLIRGHFNYDLARLLPEPPAVVTLVRDPVEHTLSHYAHVRAHLDCYPAAFRAGGHDLPAALGHPAYRELFADTQTRYLGMRLTLRLLRDCGVGPAWVARAEAAGLPADDPADPRDCLARAKARLAACACVGTTEHFGEFLGMLADRFGWPPIADDVRDNRTADRPRREWLDHSTRARIEALTALDRELYEFVRAACRERVRRYHDPGAAA